MYVVVTPVGLAVGVRLTRELRMSYVMANRVEDFHDCCVLLRD